MVAINASVAIWQLPSICLFGKKSIANHFLKAGDRNHIHKE